jgi:hypothetical protein
MFDIFVVDSRIVYLYHVRSNGGMIDSFERIWKEAVVVKSIHYPYIFLRPRNTTQTSSTIVGVSAGFEASTSQIKLQSITATQTC